MHDRIVAWPLVCVAGLLIQTGIAWAQGPRVASPLVEVPGGITGVATAVALDPGAYGALKRAADAPLTLADFSLGQGVEIDLELVPVRVMDARTRVVIGTAQGDVDIALPEVTMLRGAVSGRPDSRVFLSFAPSGSNGWVEMDGQRWILASGEGVAPMCVYNMTQLPEGFISWDVPGCGGAREVPGRPHDAGGPGGQEATGCRIVGIDIESDYEFFLRPAFGGSASAAAAYAATLVGGMSDVFSTDVDTQFVIGFLRIWPTNSDPYPDPTDVGARLDQFLAYWNTNAQGSPDRTIAHMLSGVRQGGIGGVAYLEVLCGQFAPEYSYGVSGYLNGFFPNPLVNNSNQNWDIVVTSHEVGHNFAAPHTHDLVPPVDTCGLGDCTGASAGTIMSYCHTCAGGLTNIALTLQQRIIAERIEPYLSGSAAACLGSVTVDIVSVDPLVQTRAPGQTAVFHSDIASLVPMSFAWRRNGVEISNGVAPSGAVVSGAASPQLTISNLTAAEAGVYAVEASNTCDSSLSAGLTLVISGGGCDTIDFNHDGVSPDSLDVEDFLSVYGGGTCSNDPNCGGIDFNNDGVSPDSLDIEQFLFVYGGGGC